LLVDEADTFLRDREELRGVLNAGHDRETPVMRCVGDDFEARRFAVFAPVAIAAIGNLPDTLADRSIIVSMRRKTPGDVVERCRRRERVALGDLRRKCERWALDHAGDLGDAAPTLPETLDDRAADNWEALLSIAEAAGERWSERAREAAVLLSGSGVAEDAATRSEMLLADLRVVFDEHQADRLPTKTILADLAILEGRPWAEANHGRPLSDHQLSRMLAQFAIRPLTIRLPDGSTPKGYRRESLEDAWRRYLPGATSATTPQ
jgi:putative DNA primase/helicase